MIAARTPWRMESAPSEGPTVTSCRYLIPAGSAPERSVSARSWVSSWAERSGDAALIVDLLLDGGHRFHFVIEHHRQVVADVGQR